MELVFGRALGRVGVGFGFRVWKSWVVITIRVVKIWAEGYG